MESAGSLFPVLSMKTSSGEPGAGKADAGAPFAATTPTDIAAAATRATVRRGGRARLNAGERMRISSSAKFRCSVELLTRCAGRPKRDHARLGTCRDLLTRAGGATRTAVPGVLRLRP